MPKPQPPKPPKPAARRIITQPVNDGSRGRRYGATVEPVTPEPKSTEALRKAREQVLAGITELVGLSLGTIKECLANGPTRGQGARSLDARYVLDVVLERISEREQLDDDEDSDEDGNPIQTPVDELAERRAELQKYIRIQRREQERDKKRER